MTFVSRRRIARRPVIVAALRILSFDEVFPVAGDPHGHDLEALGLMHGGRGEIQVI